MECDKKACCCKCVNQSPIYCHPCNTIGNGSIGKLFGYVCTGMSRNIFMDREHGECELFMDKQNPKKSTCPLLSDIDTISGATTLEIIETLPGMIRAAAHKCGKL